MEKKVTKKDAAKQYRENNNRVVEEAVDGFVVLKDVNKVYDNRVQAVFDFNLSVAQNEFIVLVGPSGCGKSTTLRMIAGLEEITSGYLYIDRILSNYLESKDRDIAMVFQSYALYPNMSVFDNMGLGLRVRGVPRDEIKKRVFDAAEILDLGPYLDRKPRELSGGQMQRVALGRAIVRNAKLFLMDEPLSNLDAKLRVQMRSEIVKLHNSIHATTVYVTHDQTEAMTMADRIVIMNKGVVQQIGTPMEIYNDPANMFVATFIGNPPMNVIKLPISDGKLACGGTAITLPDGAQRRYKEFIAERKAFFEDLKRKSDLAPERALVAAIDKFVSDCKKLDGGARQTALDGLCAEAERLAQKGFFAFDAERRGVLADDLARGDLGGLKRDLKALRADIQNTDLAIAGVLKRFDSAGVFKAKTKDAEPVETGKTKKKKKPEITDVSARNDALIAEYYAAYSAPDAADYAYVGIRPEDVHFASDFKGNKSETLAVAAEFVELLGSELCVYFDIGDNRVIMKSGLARMIKTGDAAELCFDMDKLRLFDAISCERVL